MFRYFVRNKIDLGKMDKCLRELGLYYEVRWVNGNIEETWEGFIGIQKLVIDIDITPLLARTDSLVAEQLVTHLLLKLEKESE